MIKEVIFDIDNTLYDFDAVHKKALYQAGLYMQEHFQMDPETFMADYKNKQNETIERLGLDNAAIHSRSIRIQNMLEEYGIQPLPHVLHLYHAYWDYILEHSRPEPGSIACMQALKDMGISIGIGTDMTAMMQYQKLEAFGFSSYITHIVTSQEAAAEKPHQAFLDRCILKAGVKPEECLFVGDNFKKDVAGAVKARMHAVWYNVKEKAVPADADIPTDSYKEARHFDEIVPYIKSLA